MKNVPIYHQELEKYNIWKDADGDLYELAEMKTPHLQHTIEFLHRQIKQDREVNKKTCLGFIASMGKELESRQ